MSASASATLRDESPARTSYDDALQLLDGQQPEESHEPRNSNDTVADENLPNSLTSYGSPIMVREHGHYSKSSLWLVVGQILNLRRVCWP